MRPATKTLALLLGSGDGLWILLPGENPRRVLATSPVGSIDCRGDVTVAAALGQGVWVHRDGEWRMTLTGDARHVRIAPSGLLLAGMAPSAVFVSTDGDRWEEWSTLQNLLRYHSQRLGSTSAAVAIGGVAFGSGTVVAVSGIGAILTVDEGRTWSLHSEGLDRQVHGIWEHPERNDRLYATSPSGFYRSEDSGYSWVQSLHGLDRSWGADVAVLPGAPDTLLLSAARRADGQESALFRSIDGGISWTRILLDGEDEWAAPPLVCSLTSPIDAFFVIAGGRAWGSHDDGERWFLIADGLPAVRSFTAAVGSW